MHFYKEERPEYGSRAYVGLEHPTQDYSLLWYVPNTRSWFFRYDRGFAMGVWGEK
jgi:hypothetical protein